MCVISSETVITIYASRSNVKRGGGNRNIFHVLSGRACAGACNTQMRTDSIVFHRRFILTAYLDKLPGYDIMDNRGYSCSPAVQSCCMDQTVIRKRRIIMYLDELYHHLMHSGATLFPASQEEINRLDNIYGPLPRAYIEYLTLMGAGTSGGLFPGASCYIDELFELNAWARELLADNNSALKLKNDDFVFWMSQGCMFCFFHLKAGDDPPVYYYTEMKPDRFRKISGSLSGFMSACCRNPGKLL